MAKKDPVQSASPDPRDKYEDEASARRLSKIRDVAGAVALPTAIFALGTQVAKEDREMSKKGDEKRENDAAARENQKKYGMKKGGKVSSASSRADGIAKRGKTRGMMK